MPLDATKFRTISGGGKQIHHYDAGADTAATAGGSGYFNAITNRLHQGDVIHVFGTGATALDTLAVTSATGAAVVTTALSS